MSHFPVEAEAEIRGYNKTYVWVRVWHELAPRILTMPRDFLPHGMATAKKVLLAYDPDSFRHDGHGFTVDGEIVRMLNGETET